MKKILNNDLIKRLESKTKNPKPLIPLKGIQDLGFRNYMAEIIVSDDKRRKDFTSK